MNRSRISMTDICKEDSELTEWAGNWLIVEELLDEFKGCKELGAD